MKPNPSFQNQSSDFWALVKYVSGSLGYSKRSRKTSGSNLKRYNLAEVEALADNFAISDNVETVVEYLNYRASLIENDIRTLLMDREKAQIVLTVCATAIHPIAICQ